MGKPSKHLMEFMEKFGVLSDEIWEVRAGGAWAIKHSALERVAAEQKIVFERPDILQIDLANKLTAVCVSGTMGLRSEWSFGESAPYNTKPGYPAAMAEKRAKDRVALKLLNAHGALYSESEADEFVQRENPHVTRPEDIMPATEYDEHGQPVDNIPHGDETIERMPKAKARADFAVCQNEIHACKSIETLDKWGKANRNRVATFPTDWAEILRGLYTEHRDTLRAAKVAAE